MRWAEWRTRATHLRGRVERVLRRRNLLARGRGRRRRWSSGGRCHDVCGCERGVRGGEEGDEAAAGCLRRARLAAELKRRPSAGRPARHSVRTGPPPPQAALLHLSRSPIAAQSIAAAPHRRLLSGTLSTAMRALHHSLASAPASLQHRIRPCCQTRPTRRLAKCARRTLQLLRWRAALWPSASTGQLALASRPATARPSSHLPTLESSRRYLPAGCSAECSKQRQLRRGSSLGAAHPSDAGAARGLTRASGAEAPAPAAARLR
jgi:hypothetical protein